MYRAGLKGAEEEWQNVGANVVLTRLAQDDVQLFEEIDRRLRENFEWKNGIGRIGKIMDGWMGGWMDGWTDGRIDG